MQMKYHVEFNAPEAAICEGPGRNDFETTHETFEAARNEAIALLEEHIAKAQGFLSDIREASVMGDLPRYLND